jgi:hypothetical protein
MANYAVVRVKRDVLSRSTVGFLAVSKDVRLGGGRAPYQRAVGLDLDLSAGRNYFLTAMLARSLNPNGDGDDWAGNIKAGQNSDLWAYSLEYTYLGPELSVNQVGYITQVDRRRTNWSVGWKPRPERYDIRRIELTLSGDSASNFGGLYTEGGLSGGFHLQTMDYLDLNLKTSVDDTRWRDVYAPDPFATSERARLYRSWSWSVSVSTDRTKDYSFNLSAEWGDFLDFGDAYWGRSGQVRTGFSFKPSERLSGSLNLTHIREYLRDRTLDETKNLLVTRGSYYFTSNLSVGVYNQYRLFTTSAVGERDTGANTLNLVISYYLNAKSVLYIVYNELRDDRIGGGEYYRAYGSLPVSDRVLFTKFTYWFSM